MVADALSAFAVALRDRHDSDSDGELAQEMESALDHVHDLVRHRLQLAATLIDLFRQHNYGQHPGVEDLSDVCGHHRGVR